MFEEIDLKIADHKSESTEAYYPTAFCTRSKWCTSNSSCAGTSGKYCC